MNTCPNCRRQFIGWAHGAYCEECWRGWSKNDGTFEARKVDMARILSEQLSRPRLKPAPAPAPAPAPQVKGDDT